VILASSPDEKTARLFRLLRYFLSLKKRKTASYQSIESLLGIIRDAELWRLFRGRNKRHTFIVRRLVLWQARGVDIDQAMLALSTYVGHVRVSNTYWYLSGVPELLGLAGERFEPLALAVEVNHV
jgi:hypothetical protein